MHAYRFQPVDADLHGIQTETSEGELAGGVHVFASLEEAKSIFGWLLTTEPVELATIECDESDLRDSGDVDGYTLRAGRGRIVSRKVFPGGLREANRWIQQQ